MRGTRDKRERMRMGEGIKKTELGGLGHYGNIGEVRFQEDTLVSFYEFGISQTCRYS